MSQDEMNNDRHAFLDDLRTLMQRYNLMIIECAVVGPDGRYIGPYWQFSSGWWWVDISTALNELDNASSMGE